MGSFRHHPDGIIYIDGEPVGLSDFVAVQPGYELPAGVAGVDYVQGKKNGRRRAYDAKGNHVPWPSSLAADLDLHISRKNTILSDIAARNAPTPPTPAEAMVKRLGEAKAHMAAVLAAGVTYGGASYALTPTDQQRITAVAAEWRTNNRLPGGGATLRKETADGSTTELDGPTWSALAEAAGDFVVACVTNLDAIKAAIQSIVDDVDMAEGDKRTAIEGYDITAGWP